MEIYRKHRPEPVLAENRIGEVEYLTFPALEKTGMVKHLISTRVGGVSEAHLSSMNLSYSRGDLKENVDENYRRIAEVLGRNKEDFVCSDQTHTTNIRVVGEEDRGKGLTRQRDYSDVDGLVTNVRGIVLSTFYADCVPLLFVDPVHRAIGLSHSGWRGTVLKMPRNTVETMHRVYGTEPADIIAAIGPSICQGCYEVSGDVAGEFKAVFTDPAMTEAMEDERIAAQILYQKSDGKFLLNLWKANECILREAGVRQEQIFITDICTCCNPDYLFSHRASSGMRGNLGVFLSLN